MAIYSYVISTGNPQPWAKDAKRIPKERQKYQTSGDVKSIFAGKSIAVLVDGDVVSAQALYPIKRGPGQTWRS